MLVTNKQRSFFRSNESTRTRRSLRKRRAGKVVLTGTRSISRDGKVMTITTKGTNARGQTVSDVEVFEKR